MTRSTLVFAIAIAIFVPVQAAAGQHGQGNGPKPKPTTHASSPATTPTTQHRGGQATAKTTPQGHATAHTTTKAAAKGTKTTTNGKTTTVATTGTLTPVQQKLQRNTTLASKLQSRLPVGTDMLAASAGFRNLGQFVAAVNVSNNLGIPFAELKTRMVNQGMSLGQAIQSARPATTNTTTVVRRAESEADEIIRETESATPKTKTTPKKHGSE